MIVGLTLAAVVAAAPTPPPAAAPAAAEAEGVEVTARPPPVVGDMQKGVLVFKPDFFTPVRPGTAQDMVNWLPGFTFEDTRDMRGLEGSTGNVLIDGKPPTSKTDTLNAVLRRIPADQVERIDIIVGGAPGIDMHGRPIIANVILKVSATIQRQVNLADYFDMHGREYPSLQLSSSEKRGDRIVQASLDVARNLYVGPNEGYGTWTRYGGAGGPGFAANSRFLQGGTFIGLTGLYQFPFAGGALKANGSVR